MRRLIQRCWCRLRGHSPARTHAVFFRSWDGVVELGSEHCARCGTMLGEYRLKNGVREKLKKGTGLG